MVVYIEYGPRSRRVGNGWPPMQARWPLVSVSRSEDRPETRRVEGRRGGRRASSSSGKFDPVTIVDASIARCGAV